MESDKVNHILMMLSSKIPAGSIPSVRTRLENTDISESEILALHSQMKDPCYQFFCQYLSEHSVLTVFILVMLV